MTHKDAVGNPVDIGDILACMRLDRRIDWGGIIKFNAVGFRAKIRSLSGRESWVDLDKGFKLAPMRFYLVDEKDRLVDYTEIRSIMPEDIKPYRWVTKISAREKERFEKEHWKIT